MDQFADIPLTSEYSSLVKFVINDAAYIGMDPDFHLFYRYFPLTDEWERIEDCGYDGAQGFGFSIGQFGYVGAGYFFVSTDIVFLNEVWKLDPELLSVSDNNLKNVGVYPNPASNNITINGLDGKLNYAIYSTDGKLIATGTAENNIINIEQMQTGVYILKLSNRTGTIYRRILKN